MDSRDRICNSQEAYAYRLAPAGIATQMPKPTLTERAYQVKNISECRLRLIALTNIGDFQQPGCCHCSRIAVGWSLSSRMTTAIVTDTLEMAIANRRPAAGLIHHSSRGAQDASVRFQRLLTQHSYQCSMSRNGNCWDNAVAESFFRTLKSELNYQHRYGS